MQQNTATNQSECEGLIITSLLALKTEIMVKTVIKTEKTQHKINRL